MRGARPLTRPEISAIRDALGGRDRALVELLLCCACRLGEMLALNVGDVRAHDRVVDDLYIRRATTKTKTGRVVPLNNRARTVIEVFLAEKASRGEALDDTSPLFASRRQQRLSRSQASRVFARVRDRLQLSGQVSSHSMRKTAATTLAKRGVSLRAIQELLGHRDLASLHAYLGVDEAELRAAVDELDM